MKKIILFLSVMTLFGCSKSKYEEQLEAQIESLKSRVTDYENQVDFLKLQIDLINKKLENKVKNENNTGLNIPLLKKTISSCVIKVRELAPPGANEMNSVYVKFDAYFNEASGKVLNNNQYVSQDAVYAFNKCMHDSGFPLK